MSRFRPTFGKVIAPLALVFLSFIPNMLIQQGLFGVLSYPLSFIYHGPPFVYRDKPMFITPVGAIVTAVVWAVIIYFLICLFARRASRCPRWKTILVATIALAVVAVVPVVATMVSLDRSTWSASRRLAKALDGSHQVALVEYVENVEIARKLATPEEISRLRKSITTWPRPFLDSGYLCFEPHHSIEILGGSGSKFECNVCFLCERFTTDDGTGEDGIVFGSLPAYIAKPLSTFFTSVGMSPKTDEEYTEILVRAHRTTTIERVSE